MFLLFLVIANMFCFALNMALGVWQLTEDRPDSAVFSFIIGLFNMIVAILLLT
jgi:hypothetical protein